MRSELIYLDYNASTPVLPEVLDAMLPYFSDQFANPASHSHEAGRMVAEAVEIAREQVASLIGVTAQEMIFTSGATESLNLAIQGLWRVFKQHRRRFLVLCTEHHAVLDVLKHLKSEGAQVEMIPVDAEGRIDVERFKMMLSNDVLAVCAMAANNETGRIHPVAELSGPAHEFGAYFICDATQAMGKMPFTIENSGADLVAVSAHKFYGPKGIGALFIRRKNPRVKILPLLFGGGHEKGLRPGTPASPLIIGMGKAAILAEENLEMRMKCMLQNRELAESILLQAAGVQLNVNGSDRLPNTTNFRIEGKKASELFSRLPMLACSSGSACTSALPEPSHVLLAMGLTPAQAYSSIRISTGINTRADEIEKAINLILGKTR